MSSLEAAQEQFIWDMHDLIELVSEYLEVRNANN